MVPVRLSLLCATTLLHSDKQSEVARLAPPLYRVFAQIPFHLGKIIRGRGFHPLGNPKLTL
jgi:hypothetical protein